MVTMSDSGPPGGSFDNWAFRRSPRPGRRRRLATAQAHLAGAHAGGGNRRDRPDWCGRRRGGRVPDPRASAGAGPGGGSPTPIPTNAGRPRPAASALYQQALATMRAANGFHYVLRSRPGPRAETIIGDAGQPGGRQVITFTASYGAEQFTSCSWARPCISRGIRRRSRTSSGSPRRSAPARQQVGVGGERERSVFGAGARDHGGRPGSGGAAGADGSQPVTTTAGTRRPGSSGRSPHQGGARRRRAPRRAPRPRTSPSTTGRASAVNGVGRPRAPRSASGAPRRR